MIENPVSSIATHWRKPNAAFHPWQYTGFCQDDNYTKKTCLWTGNGFVMPPPLSGREPWRAGQQDSRGAAWIGTKELSKRDARRICEGGI